MSHSLTKLLGWLLGLDDLESVDHARFELTASWADGAAFWVLLACLALTLLSLLFYRHLQPQGPVRVRTMLGFVRGLLLSLLLLTLAAPVLKLTGHRVLPPLLYLVFDGTESMELTDDYQDPQRQRLQSLLPRPAEATRRQLLQAWLQQDQGRWLADMQQRGLQLEPFVFEGQSASRLRKLDALDENGQLDAQQLAEALTATGQVTELGAMLDDVQQQFGAGRLAGVVLFSDFAHNGSTAPLGRQGAAARLGVPLYTVGLGAAEAADLSLELQTDPRMKRAERTTLLVRLKQAGLQGQAATVSVAAQPLRGDAARQSVPLGRRTVQLHGPVQLVEFPFTPEDSGEFQFTASVEPLPGEAATENNRTVRRANIIDDYLRLMYVAYEPTWEWHFVKEVFHRDKLVGMQGFRTYLSSSDPRVRQSNVLFLPTLTPRRSEFFANDVIFLGDMPRTALNERFAEIVREFVSEHGGGLVVLAGPRFGPRQLQDLPLADMLPVVLDPNATLQDAQEFALRRTPHAARYPFMQLGDTPREDEQAWQNMTGLPFYQPVLAVHEQATVLAEHPVDLCRDGRTRQPLIAIRPFGKGEVVYLAFNEMWRLRRKYGERYYRQFWSQLIYRLGMSHALGADKRFRVSLSGQRFRAEDEVTLRVEAFDENYEPLQPAALADGALHAELAVPGDSGVAETRSLPVAYLRRGVFEARFPVFASGQYVVRVRDPVTGEFQQRRFEVSSVSAEQLRVVRDQHLQQELAEQSGGRSYELTQAAEMVRDIEASPVVQRLSRDHPLWATPLWFSLLMVGMLGEWLTRKMIHLN